MSDPERKYEKFREKYPKVSESDLRMSLRKIPPDQQYLKWVDVHKPFLQELWKIIEIYKPLLSKELIEINSLTQEGFNRFIYKHSSRGIV